MEYDHSHILRVFMSAWNNATAIATLTSLDVIMHAPFLFIVSVLGQMVTFPAAQCVVNAVTVRILWPR